MRAIANAHSAAASVETITAPNVMIAEFFSQMKKSPPCSASRKLRERERPGRPERVVQVLVLGLERGHQHEQHRAERERGRDHEHDVAAAGARGGAGASPRGRVAALTVVLRGLARRPGGAPRRAGR